MDFEGLLTECQLITNIEDIEEQLLYHASTFTIIKDVDARVLRKKFGEKLYAVKFGPDGAQHTYARFVYDPYWANGPFGADSLGLPTFNIYTPPAWRKAAYFENSIVEPVSAVPPLIDKFLDHFTAQDKDSREFLLDWLSHALKSRNGTYLCILSKIQGTGKGVLGEMCRAIFGPDNAKKVRGDALNSRFNSQFANTQFIMFDEFNLKDSTALDRAKDLVNAKLEVERKGKDAIEVINQLNGLFASNHMGAIPELGRRFSIPMTSDIQLKLIFSPEEIRSLQYDDELLSQFAKYLWLRSLNITRDMWVPFVSARTNEVRDYGLKEWESLLCEEVFNRCPKGAFVRQDSLKKILAEKTKLRSTPGRKPFGELAFKFPDLLKHHYRMDGKRQEWGLTIVKAFPDFQPGFWCETCEGLIPEGCNCRRDP
jgi:hypothetical protein